MRNEPTSFFICILISLQSRAKDIKVVFERSFVIYIRMVFRCLISYSKNLSECWI